LGDHLSALGIPDTGRIAVTGDDGLTIVGDGEASEPWAGKGRSNEAIFRQIEGDNAIAISVSPDPRTEAHPLTLAAELNPAYRGAWFEVLQLFLGLDVKDSHAVFKTTRGESSALFVEIGVEEVLLAESPRFPVIFASPDKSLGIRTGQE